MKNEEPHTPNTVVVPQRRRSPVPFAIVAVLFVLSAYLTWHTSWFGNSLSDEDIGKYLADNQKPLHVQHALEQVEERIEKRDPGVSAWYPQVVALAGSPVVEIRKTVAWVMGNDNGSEEFHQTLIRLLADPEPIVRRNAAVQLARFNDGRGREELRAVLLPYDVVASVEGVVASTLPEGSAVSEGTLLARIKRDTGETYELRSPLPGKIRAILVREGARANLGDRVFSLAPDQASVYEALRSFVLVGSSEDLPFVQPFAQGDSAQENVKKQAILTASSIKSRSDSVP
jgi:HEAT repeat protein